MKSSALKVLLICALTPLLSCGQTTLSQGIVVRSAVAPVYPPLAATANTSGDVEVEITLDKTGNVTKADIVSGHPLLRYAALQAAKRWKFESTNEGSKVRLAFSFRIMPKESSEEDMTAVFKPPYGFEVRSKLPKPTVNYGRGALPGRKRTQTP